MTAVQIKDINDNFSKWANQDFISEELKDSILKADILFIPYLGVRGKNDPIFPTETTNIFKYFKEILSKEINVDICISDDNFQTFSHYSSSKKLGKYLIRSIAIPLFVSAMGGYIQNIIDGSTKPNVIIKDESTHTTVNIETLDSKEHLAPNQITFSVIVQDSTGNSKEINFEGPANEVEIAFRELRKYEEK